MAKELDSDNCEHRLLPQFLTDDDDELFADLKTSSKKNDARNTAKSCFGMDSWHEFGYGLGPFGSQSGLSSPLEGSTETESDDDDYVTGLTQRLAHSTFEDPALTYETNKLVSKLLPLFLFLALFFLGLNFFPFVFLKFNPAVLTGMGSV